MEAEHATTVNTGEKMYIGNPKKKRVLFDHIVRLYTLKYIHPNFHCFFNRKVFLFIALYSIINEKGSCLYILHISEKAVPIPTSWHHQAHILHSQDRKLFFRIHSNYSVGETMHGQNSPAWRLIAVICWPATRVNNLNGQCVLPGKPLCFPHL